MSEWPFTRDQWFGLPVRFRQRWWRETEFGRREPSAELLAEAEDHLRCGYPPGWPRCPHCGEPVLDGHVTCGRFECDEYGTRRNAKNRY